MLIGSFRFRVALTVTVLALAGGFHGAYAEEEQPEELREPAGDDAKPAFIDVFLERVMRAESGGRRFAKNPRSSALGPFQFITSTFLDVARRNYPGEIADLSASEILNLRTDVDFSTRAAKAFARENAAFLEARGLDATLTNLQLAHFAGPTGAVRVLKADPSTLVSDLLSQAALSANPFLTGMTAQDLLDRLGSGLDDAEDRKASSDANACPAKPKLRIRCSLGRPSCRKWVALHQRILDRKWARRLARQPQICTARLGETANEAPAAPGDEKAQ